MFHSIKATFFFLLLLMPFNAAMSQKAVYMQGTSSFEEINRIELLSQFELWWRISYAPMRTPLEKTSSGHFLLKTTLTTPGLLKFNLWNSTMQSVFATPGDSVQFTVDSISYNNKNVEYYMKFTGRNAAQWNYGHLFGVKFPYRKSPVFKKGGDIEAYKCAVEDWKDQQLEFLKVYNQEHVLTNDFLTYAKAHIENEYTFLLYLPIRHKYIAEDSLPVGYLSDVSKINFKDENLLEYYKTALALRYIHCYTNDTWNQFDLIYHNIVTEFTGRTRDFLLSALIDIFAQKQDQSYSALLLAAIKDSGKFVQDSLYSSFIKNSEAFYLKLKKEIPNDVLENTLLTAYNATSTITFKELLDSLEGKVLYIDFWASWCAPCKYDIKNSAVAKKYLEDKEVVYLYFSVDSDVEKWKTTSVAENVTHNQYLINDNSASVLLKYLGVNSFPKYVVLDKDHKLASMEAPRPTPPFFQQLKDMISRMGAKVIRFE